MAHEHCIVIERVQFLDALEAVIDEEGLGSQGVAGIDAFLDTAPHVVVPEGKTVGAFVRFDQPVHAIPDLCPSACCVHGAVRHVAIKVIGKGKLCVVLGGRGILVQIVGCIGPRDARLGCRDTVADRVVGVGVRIGGVHVGRSSCQFAPIVVGVGDGVRCSVRAAGAGHGRAPPDGVVHVAVGGYRPVLDLREEIAVRLV